MMYLLSIIIPMRAFYILAEIAGRAERSTLDIMKDYLKLAEEDYSFERNYDSCYFSDHYSFVEILVLYLEGKTSEYSIKQIREAFKSIMRVMTSLLDVCGFYSNRNRNETDFYKYDICYEDGEYKFKYAVSTERGEKGLLEKARKVANLIGGKATLTELLRNEENWGDGSQYAEYDEDEDYLYALGDKEAYFYHPDRDY